MPVLVNNRVAGVIYTSRTPSNIFDHLYQERGKFILATLTVVLGTILIGLVFRRTITRPMRELVSRVDRIGRGDRDAFRPLAHYGTREFAQLSKSFLGMAEKLSRRSDYIATFSAHLTHELKSPLTSIKGAAELLLESLQGRFGDDPSPQGLRRGTAHARVVVRQGTGQGIDGISGTGAHGTQGLRGSPANPEILIRQRAGQCVGGPFVVRADLLKSHGGIAAPLPHEP